MHSRQLILSRYQLEPAFDVDAEVDALGRSRRAVVAELGRRVRRGPAGSSASMARTSKRFTNTSTRNARSAIEERTRVGAPPAISMPNVSPADSERSVRNCRSVSSPALRPPEREHAGFLGAGVAEEPQLRGQHDHPRVPHASVVPLEVEDGARAERGRVEARAVVAERPLDRCRRAGWARAGCGWGRAPRASGTVSLRARALRARGAASAVQSARSRQTQKEV